MQEQERNNQNNDMKLNLLMKEIGEQVQRDKEKEKVYKKTNIKINVIIILLLLVIILLPFIRCGCPDNKGITDMIPRPIDGSAEQLVDETPEETDQLYIDIPGYPSVIELNSEDKGSNIGLINPEDNPVYFEFEIVIGEKNDGEFKPSESLYKSNLVEPGKVINTQEFNRSLEKGTYDAQIIIKTFSLENQSEMNGANIDVQFDVK